MKSLNSQTFPKAEAGTPTGRLGTTSRKDLWWLPPLSVAVGFGSFGIYSFWAALQGKNFEFGPYLSPFYSPLILVNWWKWSPAFLILWAPLGFRATCYYYRKAYYRAYFMDPPACAVADTRKHTYRGETSFPFILQNVHRYFLYVALIFIFILWSDFFKALNFGGKFGMGVGSLVLFLNCFLLTGYTFSCHCLRHLVGGSVDCFSTSQLGKPRHKIWTYVSALNRHHMFWAWTSLFTVGFTDLYIRLCAMGIWTDIRLF